MAQLMNRREVMMTRFQKSKANGDALWGADQVQPPPEELLLLSRTVAAEHLATHFFAAPGPHPLDHRQRQTVDDEHFSFCKEFSHQYQRALQPPGQSMEPAVVARDAQGRNIARANHHA